MARFTSPDGVGEPGPQGPVGPGVAAGGTEGQILAKIDGIDYNTEWIDNFTSSVKHEVKAGVALNIGQAVYITGSTGGSGTNMIVGKASNASEATSSKTLGLVAQNLNTNDIGFVVTEGLLAGIDTSTATVGDPVWLGTDGNLIFGLANKPYAPAHLVYLGTVTRTQQNNGEIFVHVQNGFELHELHDVALEDKTSMADNEILSFDSASGLWKNQTPSESGFATVATSGSYNDLTNKPTIPSNLDSLTDVTITGTPTDKQLIVWDSATSQWKNQDAIASTGIAYKSGFPASPTSTGIVGQLAIDGTNGVLYICTATNTWQKVSLNAANFTNPGGFL